MKTASPRLKRWRTIGGIIALFYVLLCISMAVNQRSFIYIPRPGPIEPAEAGLTHYTRKEISDTEGTKIVYWESVNNEHLPLLIYFHGNGGGLHQFVPALDYLQQHKFHVVAMEYRGYPGSPEGKSEQNIVKDGTILVNHFHQQYPKQKLIYWGYSLGSGIATQVATRLQPDAMVLEAPFTAVVDRAGEMLPILPAKYLMRDTYLSRTAIGKLHMPLFIMHGDQDWIIPLHHGKDLFALANEPKQFKMYSGYGHLDLIHSTAYNDAVEFIKTHTR